MHQTADGGITIGMATILQSPQSMTSTFNFAEVLPKRTTSPNTQRAYYRWIDRYLVDVGGLKATRGDNRYYRMTRLPLKTLVRTITARKLTRWLLNLAEEGHGKQGLDQARAAIVTLADFMEMAGWLEGETVDALHSVKPPSVETAAAEMRLLSITELKQLITAARNIATTENQQVRNHLVSTMLCTMALRRDELSAAKWGDIFVQDNQIWMQVRGAGIRDDAVEVPRPVIQIADRWRKMLQSGKSTPEPHTPLVRRIWKGGRIAKDGLSPDGIWLIIRDSALFAGLGHVTPDDLRRSVAVGLRDAGLPIEEISRIMRHRSVLVTERFLSKLESRPNGSNNLRDADESDL